MFRAPIRWAPPGCVTRFPIFRQHNYAAQAAAGRKPYDVIAAPAVGDSSSPR
jgi:hypothetical protein